MNSGLNGKTLFFLLGGAFKDTDSIGNSASWVFRGFGEQRGRRQSGVIQRQEAQLRHMQRCFLLVFETQQLSSSG